MPEKALTEHERSLLTACQEATWAVKDIQNGDEPNLEPILTRLSASVWSYTVWDLRKEGRYAEFLDVAEDLQAYLGLAKYTLARGKLNRASRE